MFRFGQDRGTGFEQIEDTRTLFHILRACHQLRSSKGRTPRPVRAGRPEVTVRMEVEDFSMDGWPWQPFKQLLSFSTFKRRRS